MPAEVAALNMLQTNTENMGIGQLLSHTYHRCSSPLARDTSAILLVGIINCQESLETLSPEIPSWKLYQLLPLHIHKRRSAQIVHNRMPFHGLAISVPAIQAPTDNYPKDTHLSDLQMLRHRYKLSSTTHVVSRVRDLRLLSVFIHFLMQGKLKAESEALLSAGTLKK